MSSRAKGAHIRDLVVLVPDKNTEYAARGILQRHQALGIRELDLDVFAHPERDPGVYRRAAEFLRPLQSRYRYALVIMDREGSGRNDPAEALEQEVQARLDRAGWEGRSAIVVIEPELEIWVWADSPHIAAPLGWASRGDLVGFLRRHGLWSHNCPKPSDPRAALEKALREKRVPRSSSIYRALAQRVGLSRCTDRAFLRLLSHLRGWFAAARH